MIWPIGLEDLRTLARFTVDRFNAHVESCPDCGPSPRHLCSTGDRLNDEASEACGRHLLASAAALPESA